MSKNSPDIMSWDKCRKKFIRKVSIDEERIKSIVEKAMQRLDRARNTKATEKNVSFVVEDYYEVIKELLIAYLLKDGFRAKNHQCLITYFFRQNPNCEREAYIISQMSFFRNRLDYYGEDIPLAFYEENKKDFDEIITFVLKLIQNKK